MLGFLLLGKNSDLAFWEVMQLARRRGEGVKRVSERFVLVESSDMRFYARLAYTRVFGVFRFFFRRFSELPCKVAESGLRREIARLSSFYVRSFPKSRSVERRVGWYLDGNARSDSPNVVRVVRAGNAYAVLFPSVEIRGQIFSQRDARRRPFFHPTAMNARDARMLVNLSAVLPGERFLDPFCGTGALLIEAALVGAEAVGIDADPRMVEGARRNLAFFCVSGKVIYGDARALEGKYDAIATDPPYGRSSKVLGSDIRRLYTDAFSSMHGVLKRGRYCVVVGAEDLSSFLERAGFYVMHVGNWYVHKNLTRRVHICRA